MIGEQSAGLICPTHEQSQALASPRVPRDLDDNSPAMSACHVLRLNLSDVEGRGSPAPLVVLSQTTERSCALVSAGLALSLAQEGCRTLLVDTDPQAPVLHTLFGLESGPGFTDLLADWPASGVPAVAVDDGLWLLPAGSPGIQLDPGALPDVARHLAAEYDAVIYQVVLSGRATTGLQLAREVGSVIFTVRAGVDAAEPLRRMRMALERAGVAVLGFTLVEEP